MRGREEGGNGSEKEMRGRKGRGGEGYAPPNQNPGYGPGPAAPYAC